MDTWTKQMGYPIISISFNSEKNAYELKQKRFLADPDNKPETPSIFKYVIFNKKSPFHKSGSFIFIFLIIVISGQYLSLVDWKIAQEMPQQYFGFTMMKKHVNIFIHFKISIVIIVR